MKICHIVLLTCVVFFVIVGFSYSAEECSTENMPHDPDYTFCQSGMFEQTGRPEIVFIKCPDYGYPCAVFQKEHYTGVLGCCTSSDCRKCLPKFDPALGLYSGLLWGAITSDVDMWYCEITDEEQFDFYGNQYCNGSPTSSWDVEEETPFCGCCESSEQVCTEFWALFNPCLNPKCSSLHCAIFDLLPSACWDSCGENMEFFFRCVDKGTCGDVNCITL